MAVDEEISKSDESNQGTPRKRGLTSLTLQWFAERVRKAERIKAELAEGKYQVKADKIASALLNEEEK